MSLMEAWLPLCSGGSLKAYARGAMQRPGHLSGNYFTLP